MRLSLSAALYEARRYARSWEVGEQSELGINEGQTSICATGQGLNGPRPMNAGVAIYIFNSK